MFVSRQVSTGEGGTFPLLCGGGGPEQKMRLLYFERGLFTSGADQAAQRCLKIASR